MIYGYAGFQQRWLGLSEQFFRFDKWSACRGVIAAMRAVRLADGVGVGAETLPTISCRVALLGDCKLGWGRGGGGVPVPHNEAGPAKGDECDEQRGEVEFYGRVHFKTSWLAKVILNHAGLAPDRKRRVWICLKSQGLAWLGHGTL
jgi:hypothetical protein